MLLTCNRLHRHFFPHRSEILNRKYQFHQNKSSLIIKCAQLDISWNRWHQNILFVDDTDVCRSRLALAFFENLSAWNGYDRLLVLSSCGIQAQPDTQLPLSTMASLMSFAKIWDLRSRAFISPNRQSFDTDDVDRFDVIVCLSDRIHAEVLKRVSADRPASPGQYVNKICTLTDFIVYCPDDRLLQGGGSGLLDSKLRKLVALHLPTLRPSPAIIAAATSSIDGDSSEQQQQQESNTSAIQQLQPQTIPSFLLPDGIPRPSLSSATDNAAEWERMALLTAICCAGLMCYIMDALPPDLPHWEPED